MQALTLRRGCVVCLAAKNAKVNERGKVSSRPGPPSPKELAKQRKQQQQPSADSTLSVQSQQQNDVASTSGADVASTTNAQSSNTTAQQSSRQAAPSVTPQVVVDRIFARMVACAGIPMAAGIVLLFVFYYLKKQGGDDFPVWPAYVSQAVTLLGGLGGITYGALSASWDPAREGSALGWTEFRANLPIFLSKKE